MAQTVMNRNIPITVTLTRPLAPTVKQALDGLRHAFPNAFTQPPRPLAEDVLPAAQEYFATQYSKKSIRRALSAWCNQVDYLRAVVTCDEGCVHLDGSEAGPVTDVQRQQARQRLELKGSPVNPTMTFRKPPVRSQRQTVRFGEPVNSPELNDPTADSGPRVSVRQRPKLDRVLADTTITPTQRPKLSLKKPPSEAD